MSSTCCRTCISGCTRPTARSRAGSVTSTRAGGRTGRGQRGRALGERRFDFGLESVDLGAEAAPLVGGQRRQRFQEGRDRPRLAAEELVVERLEVAIGGGGGQAGGELGP